MNKKISVLILACDEELHIRRCIEKLQDLSDDIVVLDSGSADATAQIAAAMPNARVVFNPWPGVHSAQVNWGLKNIAWKNEWILRIDADEYLSEKLVEEIKAAIANPPENVSGFILRRRHIFMGKLMRHGSNETLILRLWKLSDGRCDDAIMDEHIILERGEAMALKNLFFDHNLKPLSSWIDKHNSYAGKEALKTLRAAFSIGTESKKGGEMIRQKNAYARLPLFFRALLYFIYRYIFRLGFLDGKEGFCWHFFQALWYRTLVDAKILEIQKSCGFDRDKIEKFLREKTGS
ncbi:MAG: glycosyltransferase family 2 protein [Opitutales bacterium]|nr:glycosyltransferase family 2 protein [Opitutales bacterium]